MSSIQSLKIYEIFPRYFNNDVDAKIVVEEIQQIVERKYDNEKQELTSKTEMQLFRKDIEAMELRLSGKIENSSLRTESSLKSEINKLIIWIVATMLASGALFITLAKVFFDK
jgi:hypothetical protein